MMSVISPDRTGDITDFADSCLSSTRIPGGIGRGLARLQLPFKAGMAAERTSRPGRPTRLVARSRLLAPAEMESYHESNSVRVRWRIARDAPSMR